MSKAGNKDMLSSDMIREGSFTRMGTEHRRNVGCGLWKAKCPETPGSAVCGYRAKRYKTQLPQTMFSFAHRDLDRAQLDHLAAPTGLHWDHQSLRCVCVCSTKPSSTWCSLPSAPISSCVICISLRSVLTSGGSSQVLPSAISAIFY